ncbi:MAG: nucleoside-diphosphate kinase [Candidatus Cloacimonetes bacterium 4572_65]|nr:MAG: nucleoside-diphosphate kinase [Candidatus Cloacimonetes bacterium 4572_65]
MEKTLILIKPNAVRNQNIGEIISILEKSNFTITNIKLFTFDSSLAQTFYQEHAQKEFFPRLITFICSGETIALELKRENAIKTLRNLVGDANPKKRESGTIRDYFADSVTENAVHASDSPESAIRELSLIF